MAKSTSFMLLLIVGTVSVYPSTASKHLEPLPEMMTLGKHLDLVVEFFSKLYLPLFEGVVVQDPVTFYDFVYDFTWELQSFFSEGEANITNPNIVGMSNFERRLTINVERREIGLHIGFPKVFVLGNYSMNRVTGGCVPTIGCSEYHHVGYGGYNHTFTGVTFDAKYILDDSTSPDSDGSLSIRYSPFNFAFHVDGVSLYADNYTLDGVPQTNWDERSQDWLERYVNSWEGARIANILFGEATAIVMNYSSRVFAKSIDDIFEELLGFGAEIVP